MVLLGSYDGYLHVGFFMGRAEYRTVVIVSRICWVLRRNGVTVGVWRSAACGLR